MTPLRCAQWRSIHATKPKLKNTRKAVCTVALPHNIHKNKEKSCAKNCRSATNTGKKA
jgi:hypothetical protein